MGGGGAARLVLALFGGFVPGLVVGVGGGGGGHGGAGGQHGGALCEVGRGLGVGWLVGRAAVDVVVVRCFPVGVAVVVGAAEDVVGRHGFVVVVGVAVVAGVGSVLVRGVVVAAVPRRVNGVFRSPGGTGIWAGRSECGYSVGHSVSD